MPTDPNLPSSWIELVERGGGWLVLVVFLAWGGRSFMSLAREFSTQVVQKLEAIRVTIAEQQAEFAQLANRVNSLHDSVDHFSRRIDRHLPESDSDILRRTKNQP